MGFLKLKKVGKYSYWYWCERRRAKKRQGASGRVKSVDLCLGEYINTERVSFYVWAGDIPLKEYIDQALPNLLPPLIAPYVDCIATLKPEPSVKLRAKPGSGIDLRRKEWTEVKQRVKAEFEDVCFYAFENVDYYLESAKKNLSNAKEWDQEISEWEEKLKVYRADPERTWDHHKVWVNTVTKEEIEDRDFRLSRHSLDEWELYERWSLYPDDYQEKTQSHLDWLHETALEYRQRCKADIETIVAMAPKNRQREARERLLKEFKIA